MRIRFHTIAYGQEYCDVFTKCQLPSVLANKDVFLDNDCKYVIYSTPKDFEYMQDRLKTLDLLADLEFKDIKDFQADDKYKIINRIFDHSVSECYRTKSIFRSIPCDGIMTDTSLVNTLEAIKDGKKGVFLPTGAIRVDWKATIDEVGDNFNGITANDLTDMFARFMHY